MKDLPETSIIIILLLSLLSLPGCTPTHIQKPESKAEKKTKQKPKHNPYIDPALRKYVEIVEDRYNIYIQFPVTMVERFDNDDVGRCEVFGESGKIIYIKESYWDEAMEPERKALIFHEVGHCYFGLEHDNRVDAKGLSTSFMNDTVRYTSTKVNYEEMLVDFDMKVLFNTRFK